jgi:hypothetical protein
MFSERKIAYGLTRASMTGALVLFLAASAAAQEPPVKPSAKQQEQAIKLVVENHNYLDMNVYAMRDGMYRPLGVVTGLSKAELAIPRFMTMGETDFELLANPIGSNRSYLTGPILFGSAKEIDLTIESDLGRSWAMPGNRGFGSGPGSVAVPQLRWRTRG